MDRIIVDGGSERYAEAVTMYLSFVISKLIDYNCSLVAWYPQEDRPSHVFTKQAVPMVWDFVELNPFTTIGGTWEGCLDVVASAMTGLPALRGINSEATQADAAYLQARDRVVVCTDPPYYDNIGYADLSDFFYVWLRRSLGAIFPDLTATMLTPKSAELVANPFPS